MQLHYDRDIILFLYIDSNQITIYFHHKLILYLARNIHIQIFSLFLIVSNCLIITMNYETIFYQNNWIFYLQYIYMYSCIIYYSCFLCYWCRQLNQYVNKLFSVPVYYTYICSLIGYWIYVYIRNNFVLTLFTISGNFRHVLRLI